MADGQVLIDSKIDTSGVKTGVDDIKQLMESTAKIASTAADNIENAFKDVNYKGAFEKMPAELQKAYVQMESIRANDGLSQKKKAEEIAKIYEDLGYTQKQASTIAWQAMEADTTKGSRIIIQGLSNIQAAAEESGSGVAGSFSEIDKTASALGRQTKAVASALDAAGNKQGALSATSKGLNQQLEAQKKKFAMLETVMALVTAEYGENSIEAIEVNTRMAETKTAIAKLEAEISDTDKKLDDLADGLEETGDALDDIPEGANGASTSLKDLFKVKVGGDLLVSSLKKVAEWCVEIGKQAIEAAADVQASNAQFEQTFKGIESTARETLNSIADESGITATRMQGSFTKIYAFTKSVGGDTQKAMNISSRAMKAAADSAAYYDRTLEETTESLMSFLKGNYENDAALGIAATETTRNAKANELYAKSFKDLSESQKVDVLLAMVEAGNEASGALGQAAREADQWTNVTGEFNEAWKQLLATLGSPVLQAITPIVQGLTSAMKGLVEQTASEELAIGMKNFDAALEDANETLKVSEREIERNAIKAGLYAKKLRELEPQVAISENAQREYANAVAQLNELYPELNLQIDKETGLLDKNSQAQLNNIDALKKKYLAQAQEKRYSAVLEAQADATLDLQAAEAKLSNIQVERAAVEKILAEATGLSAESLEDLARKRTAYGASVTAGTAETNALLAELGNLIIEEDRLGIEIDEGTQKLSEHDLKLQELYETYGLTAEAASGLSEAEADVAQAAVDTTNAVEELRTEYDQAMASAKQSLDSQVGLFDKLEIKSSKSTKQIVANWESQKAGFDQYRQNLQKATEMHLDETLVQQLADGSTESMAILNELVNNTDLDVDDINAAFNELEEAKEKTAGYMSDIKTDMSDKLSGMKRDVETKWGAMADTVGKEIDEMQRYINSLQGKTAYVDVVTRYSKSGSAPQIQRGGSSSPSLQSMTESAAIPVAANLPFLASGAVIPPNAPFAAILGDQRHGTNIEAPLSTIQEAVANVLGDTQPAMVAGFEAVVDRLEVLAATIENIEIGDTTIGAAAARYQRRQDLITGVSG